MRVVKHLLLHCSPARAHRLVTSLRDVVLLSMEARDLQSVELDIEEGYEVLKDVSTLCHQFGRLLVCECLMHVLVWPLKVREKEDEDLFWVP